MENEIRKGAKWWADLLRRGEHPGSDTGNAPITEIAFAFLQERPSFTEEQIARFETALVGILTRVYIDREVYGRYKERYSPGQGFGTDYEPGDILTEAADVAGIVVERCLPAKTIMWLNDGAVRVKRGYGAPVVEIGP